MCCGRSCSADVSNSIQVCKAGLSFSGTRLTLDNDQALAHNPWLSYVSKRRILLKRNVQGSLQTWLHISCDNICFCWSLDCHVMNHTIKYLLFVLCHSCNLLETEHDMFSIFRPQVAQRLWNWGAPLQLVDHMVKCVTGCIGILGAQIEQAPQWENCWCLQRMWLKPSLQEKSMNFSPPKSQVPPPSPVRSASGSKTVWGAPVQSWNEDGKSH